MKKFLLVFSLIALVIVAFFLFANRSAKSSEALDVAESPSALLSDSLAIKAYYFHFSRRCVTCQAVEKVAANALTELSGGKIVLQSINLEEISDKALAQKLGVEGQSLLIVKGNQRVDLTSAGFLYAVASPDTFKERIKVAVGSLK
ncbi:MAG: nitrophenyl compound nitroreductase subunit ArsF family protein [Bacteroidales bacterium]